jgi:Zn-dependent protease
VKRVQYRRGMTNTRLRRRVGRRLEVVVDRVGPVQTLWLPFVVVHEVAHLVVGILVGLRPRTYRVGGSGGYVEWCRFPAMRGWRWGVTAAAGPAANLLVAFATLLLLSRGLRSGSWTHFAYVPIAAVNLWMYFVSLLPFAGADGLEILYATGLVKRRYYIRRSR